MLGTHACHISGVTHRDIKPSNVLISNDGYISLGDFGSSVDSESESLYTSQGPSQNEESIDYAPPEVIYSQIPFFEPDPTTYDIWSLGVLFLEMVLGTSKVFQISTRTQAIINHRLKNEDDIIKQHAYLFRAFVEYCIYVPQSSGLDSDYALSQTEECNETHLTQKVKEYDPTGIGIESK